MIEIIENKTPYPFSEMIGNAERENNQKRGYLFVNNVQGKHVPVEPQRSLELFRLLEKELEPDFRGTTVTMVGFAETATAIGAAAAVSFAGTAYYLQTTREDIAQEYQVVSFEEEHSHATQQMLFCGDRKKILEESDQIIFVEDEISTGKTILNFIQALEQQGIAGKFSVASLLNSMSDEQMAYYQEKGIGVYYLIRFSHELDNQESAGYAISDKELPEEEALSVFSFSGRPEPRTGLPAQVYQDACGTLADNIIRQFQPELERKRVLVLGTEECMYPAIVCGSRIQEQFSDTAVRVHATTRSPIVPDNRADYPLKNRVRLESLYEKGRSTFLYNLDAYDIVLVVTDAVQLNLTGAGQLMSALEQYGNNHIHVIRWVK